MATGRRTNGTTTILLRYLLLAFLFVILGFFATHHSILSQSNDAIDIHGWMPAAVEPNEAAVTTTTASNNLTQSLPSWLIEYAKWHEVTRRSVDWSKQPVLIVVAKDDKAEGLSDRLRAIPFLLWEAHQTKRILFIQWLRPYPLEEFLLPPVGGIDWRVPPSLNLREPSDDVVWHEYKLNFTSITDSPYQSYRVVKTQPNRFCFFEGMDFIYRTLDRKIQDEQLSRIYKLLLTPSPPVQRLLNDTMEKLGLVPKQFIGVHLRARYPDYAAQFQFIPKGWNETGVYKIKSDELGNKLVLADPKGLAVDRGGILETAKVTSQLRQLVRRAIRCARVNLPDAYPPNTIYFASDTNLAIKLAVNASEHIVGSVTSDERLHMNVDNENHEYKPSDFYPAIVDSWILSQARCLAAGQGGYSLFAAVLGGIGNCIVFNVIQNLYASRYLPHGYITIRNITFCKPQKDKMVRKLRNLIQEKVWSLQHTPRKKRFVAQATWTVGN